MTRIGKIIALIAVLCVSTELIGAFLYFLETGKVVYLTHEYLAREPDRAGELVMQAKGKPRLHPYFGFSRQFETDLKSPTNNYVGFRQRERLENPGSPGPNDFVAVVFGGSVAMHLAIGERGAATLRQSLQALPALAGRNVVLINLAQNSGKQPQQLFELAYLLAVGQRIDLVLNIDGFNEFALGYQNQVAGLHPVLPAVQVMRPLALEMSPGPESAQYYDLAGHVLSAKSALAKHTNSMRQARTGLGFLKASLLAAWNRRLFVRSTSEYEDVVVRSREWADLKQRFGLDLQSSNSDVFETLFELWLRCSQQMKVLAEASGAAYLHVIQPNQYYSKHPFSDRERQTALSLPDKHEYRLGVAGGYPLLDERKVVIQSNGIVSAIDLFDREHDEVYFDNCCHYTLKGINLMVQFVAEQVARRLN